MLLLCGCSQGAKPAEKNTDGTEKLVVYTSFYPMYDFTTKVGGDYITVENLVPAGAEPHDWEPTTRDILHLEHGDMFIMSGAGMEHWADKLLSSLENPDLVVVEASEGITLAQEEEEEEHDHHGHSHEEGDPHVWLSPKRAKQQMENIKNAMVQADPAHGDVYEANYQQYAKEFDALDEEYRTTLSALPQKSFIVAHEAFGYLCYDYGLEQVALEGLMSESEPDPARMAEVVRFAQEKGITTVFFEEMVDPKVAQTIAREIGADTATLNPLEGLTQEDMDNGREYFSVMRENLQALKEALE